MSLQTSLYVIQAEAEVKNLNSKLILLEEDNGKQEEALSDTRRRLETIEVEADENLRCVFNVK